MMTKSYFCPFMVIILSANITAKTVQTVPGDQCITADV